LTINLKEVISSNSATYVKDYIEGDFNLKEVISSNSDYIFHFSVWKIGVILFHFDLLLTFSFVIIFSPIQLYFKLIIVFWILYRYAVLRRLNDDCLVAWKSGCGRHKLLRSVFFTSLSWFHCHTNAFSVMFAILRGFNVYFLWHVILWFCSCGGLTKTMFIYQGDRGFCAYSNFNLHLQIVVE
jgi:hypothetical protein